MSTCRFCLLAVLLPVTAIAQQPAADLVLTQGRIFTGDTARPWAEALAEGGDHPGAGGPRLHF